MAKDELTKVQEAVDEELDRLNKLAKKIEARVARRKL